MEVYTDYEKPNTIIEQFDPFPNKDTKLFGSFSENPGNTGCKFFNEGFKKHGINAIYKSFKVDDIEEAIKAAKTLKMWGYAIASPFKIKAYKSFYQRYSIYDTITKSVGAINTAVRDDRYIDSYIGHNTDILGTTHLLKHWSDFSGRLHVDIIGTGGLASAVLTSCNNLGLSATIWKRETYWGDIVSLKDRLIYNCTPLALEFLSKNNILIDCRIGTSGGDILFDIQAKAQFKLYTGIDYE